MGLSYLLHLQGGKKVAEFQLRIETYLILLVLYKDSRELRTHFFNVPCHLVIPLNNFNGLFDNLKALNM